MHGLAQFGIGISVALGCALVLFTIAWLISRRL
jgi:hypothetical protein